MKAGVVGSVTGKVKGRGIGEALQQYSTMSIGDWGQVTDSLVGVSELQ